MGQKLDGRAELPSRADEAIDGVVDRRVVLTCFRDEHRRNRRTALPQEHRRLVALERRAIHRVALGQLEKVERPVVDGVAPEKRLWFPHGGVEVPRSGPDRESKSAEPIGVDSESGATRTQERNRRRHVGRWQCRRPQEAVGADVEHGCSEPRRRDQLAPTRLLPGEAPGARRRTAEEDGREAARPRHSSRPVDVHAQRGAPEAPVGDAPRHLRPVHPRDLERERAACRRVAVGGTRGSAAAAASTTRKKSDRPIMRTCAGRAALARPPSPSECPPSRTRGRTAW